MRAAIDFALVALLALAAAKVAQALTAGGIQLP
jgi:hypothetical protein